MTTLLTVPDVRGALKLSSTEDTAVASTILSVTEAIENLCGPFESRAVTEVVHGCGNLILTYTPTLSLTSITGEWVGSLNVNLLAVTRTGIVRAKRSAAVMVPDDWYTVVYNYGRSDAIPQSVKDAALSMFKSQWQIRRSTGAPRPALGGMDTTDVPGVPFPVPIAALQLLDPYLLGPSAG